LTEQSLSTEEIQIQFHPFEERNGQTQAALVAVHRRDVCRSVIQTVHVVAVPGDGLAGAPPQTIKARVDAHESQMLRWLDENVPAWRSIAADEKYRGTPSAAAPPIPRENQDQRHARLQALIRQFGAVPTGTPLDIVHQHMGLLQAAATVCRRIYGQSLQSMLQSTPAGSPEREAGIAAIDSIMLRWGAERGFNPLRPEKVPHLEIMWAASVIETVVELILMGGQQYEQRTNEAPDVQPARGREARS